MSSSAPADYDPSGRNYGHSRASQSHQQLAGGLPAGPPSDSSVRGEAPQSITSERKNRRRAARDLQIHARKRREETARQNWLHPQKPEEQWICEFCEYERIFGYPPVALIRQYEIKDRKLRQQEEERRRVWEKAKARSRKGKKGKTSNKSNNINNVHAQTADAHHAPPMINSHSQDTQSEVFDEDEYEEDGNYDLESDEPAMLVPVQKNHPRFSGHGPEGGTPGGGGMISGAISVAGGRGGSKD